MQLMMRKDLADWLVKHCTQAGLETRGTFPEWTNTLVNAVFWFLPLWTYNNNFLAKRQSLNNYHEQSIVYKTFLFENLQNK